MVHIQGTQLSSVGQPSLRRGIADKPGARLNIQLFRTARPISFNRLDADIEPVRNFLVGETEGHELKDIRFAFGQFQTRYIGSGAVDMLGLD